MKYKDFLENLEIHRTRLEKGKGVRCNLALYMYPDGHSNFYCLDDKGIWITRQNKAVCIPTNNALETVDVFIDIINKMHRKAKRIKR